MLQDATRSSHKSKSSLLVQLKSNHNLSNHQLKINVDMHDPRLRSECQLKILNEMKRRRVSGVIQVSGPNS